MGKITVLFLSFLLIALAGLSDRSEEVIAAQPAKKSNNAIPVDVQGQAVSSDGYVYYSYEKFDESGYKSGLMKLNVKTGKQEKISNHFISSLSVSGKYLVGNLGGDNAGSDSIICRIGKDGKNLKKIGKGTTPLVVGDKVYYTYEEKAEGKDSEYVLSIYRMSINGKNKKKIGETDYLKNVANSGKKLYLIDNEEILYSLSGKKVKGAWLLNNYYNPETGKTFRWRDGFVEMAVYGKGDEDRKKIAEFENGYCNWMILCDDKIVINLSVDFGNELYLMDQDGKNKKLIVRY